ncbi:D-tyrosyl-tRNA(Tyr) deacylase, partial [bacterium]
IFEDSEGKMNLPLSEVGGGILLISQFTLYGDMRKGRRPAFVSSAPPELANELYLKVAQGLRERGLFVQTGIFRAEMRVSLVNEGPVTILLDSRKVF